MPDIDPAALSRPTISLSTPILSSKTITAAVPSSQKSSKTSQIIPVRIELEPLYAALKQAIGSDYWPLYKESTTEFFVGRLNQVEYSTRIDPILQSAGGEKEHLHNQLIAAIYGNVTREMPDAGLAPWVSANDKVPSGVGAKPVTGDATERKLKGEVMQLPSRDRRRIKDLILNEHDVYDNAAGAFADAHRLQSRAVEVPPSAGGINNMNVGLEIRKRFAQPLAVESGEFPDVPVIEGRMLPYCYEAGLISGHVQDAAHFMSVAAESFVKEVLSSIFSKTRSNGPGDSGSAGFGTGTTWIQTHNYRRQLAREEEALLRGEITRDKSGLLPIEARAASERGPLGMADVRTALDMGDCGIAKFPVLTTAISSSYREGELENWQDYTWLPDCERFTPSQVSPVTRGGALMTQSIGSATMEVDSDLWWEGTESQDVLALDDVLDSCLAVGF